MKIFRRAALGAAVSCAAVVSASAQVRVEAVTGKTEVSPAGMTLWIAVSSPPYSMKIGDRLRTAKGASAELSFADRGRAELGPEAALAVEKPGPSESALKLDAGLLHARPAKGRSLRVDTAAAVATARDASFTVEVTAIQDTAVEVDRGVVAVKLKSGEKTELGPERPYRSLLAVTGRPLDLLPHPHEEAGGRKSAPGQADCLHSADGSLRKSVEEIESCQDASKAKRTLTPAAAAALREHDRQEIRRFLTVTGALPAAEVDEEPAAASAIGDSPVASRVAAGRDTAAERAALTKELGLEDAPGGGAAALTPDKLKALQDALGKQGGDPVIREVLTKAAAGKTTLTDEQARELLKSLKLDQLKLDADTPPDPDAP